MVTYIYFVKCPNCEDEPFDFFDEAKEFALGCMSKKPIITQTEVERNDFGECTDHCDLGTVWSWEDMMQDTMSEDDMVFSKNETFGISEDFNDFDDFDIGPQIDEFGSIDNSVDFEVAEPITIGASVNKFVIVGEKEDYTKQYYNQELDTWVDSSNDATLFDDRNQAIEVLYDLDKSAFYTTRVMIKLMPTTESISSDISSESDNFRKPIPEGMTIEQLVEEMEENEDTVECTLCNDLFDKSTCRKELNLGWLCRRCADDLVARGEGPVFKEDNYWDFLEEDLQELSFSEMVADSINHLINDLGKDSSAEDFVDNVITDIENNYDIEVPEDPEKYRDWTSAVACEVSRQLNNSSISEDVEPKVLHDLGNEYDGGYPAETPEVSDSHLKLCPECGKETFDIETGICVECGFN